MWMSLVEQNFHDFAREQLSWVINRASLVGVGTKANRVKLAEVIDAHDFRHVYCFHTWLAFLSSLLNTLTTDPSWLH